MRSLVMSLFSRDLLVNYIRYFQCLNLVNNYLHEYSIYSAWFLDGRISTLVFQKFQKFNKFHKWKCLMIIP